MIPTIAPNQMSMSDLACTPVEQPNGFHAALFPQERSQGAITAHVPIADRRTRARDPVWPPHDSYDKIALLQTIGWIEFEDAAQRLVPEH